MRYGIVAIGEALWDVFPDRRRPGGAPCNVAYHAARLGDHSAIVSCVGTDTHGEELITFLESRGVDTSCIQRHHEHPTGSVDIAFVDEEPQYRIAENVAWDHIKVTDAALELVRNAHAVCYGSLVQRAPESRHAVFEMLRVAHGNALTVFDVNLRPPFVDAEVLRATIKLSDVVKMSRGEVDAISELLDQDSLIPWLTNDAGVRIACVTQGKDGAILTTQDETIAETGVPVDTVAGDFVGVGDAFVAALIHKLLRDADLPETLRFANRYAAVVATRRGAMPTVTVDDVANISN